MWLKADALALSDGDPVASWTDSSGNGHSGVQGNVNRRPTFHANAQNGKPGVAFSQVASSSLSLSGLGGAIGGGQHSFMFVTKPTDLGNYPIVMTYPVDTTWSYIIEYDSNGSFYWAGGGGYAVYGTSYTAGAHLIDMVKPTGAGHFYKAGTEITDGSVATPPTMTGDMQLGGYVTGTYGMQGDICEVLAFDRALSDTDRQKGEGYLAWKYGLAGDLPGGHPYKAAAP